MERLAQLLVVAQDLFQVLPMQAPIFGDSIAQQQTGLLTTVGVDSQNGRVIYLLARFILEFVMFEFISSVIEAMSGFLVGRLRAKYSILSHISLVFISVISGFIFFFAFGIYELISPAPKPIGNIWRGLLYFSIGISLFTYLILITDRLIKKKKAHLQELNKN